MALDEIRPSGVHSLECRTGVVRCAKPFRETSPRFFNLDSGFPQAAPPKPSAPASPTPSAYRHNGTDLDCAHFGNQRLAQVFFEASGYGDPYHLDGDGDGFACERLR